MKVACDVGGCNHRGEMARKEEQRRGGLKRRHWERIGTYLFTVERDMR